MSPLTKKTLIESGPSGKRVICTSAIAAFEPLFTVIGRRVPEADRHSIQIGPGDHLTPDGAPWSLVNHACTPNTAIDFGRWQLYALRAIAPGEELGWNYLTTEWDLSCPFQCGCGSPECVGEVRGFRYLSPDDRAKMAHLLSPFLRSRIGVYDADTPASVPVAATMKR